MQAFHTFRRLSSSHPFACIRHKNMQRPFRRLSSVHCRYIFGFVDAKKEHTLEENQVVPFSAEEFYQVVADVDKYDEFVPFCTASRIVSKKLGSNPVEFDAELSVGFKLFTEKYISRVTAIPPSSIDVCAIKSPTFKHLRSSWKFYPRGENSCQVHFKLDFAVKSMLHAQAMNMFLHEVAQYQIKAFQKRCQKVYRSRKSKTPKSDVVSNFHPSAPASVTKNAAASHASRVTSSTEAWDRQAVSTFAEERKWLEDVFIKHCISPPECAMDTSRGGGIMDFAALLRACKDLDRIEGFGEVADSPGLAAAVFSAIDNNPTDGWIDKDEFVHGIYILTKASPKERAEHFFHKVNTKNDNVLCREEITQLLERYMHVVIQPCCQKAFVGSSAFMGLNR